MDDIEDTPETESSEDIFAKLEAEDQADLEAEQAQQAEEKPEGDNPEQDKPEGKPEQPTEPTTRKFQVKVNGEVAEVDEQEVVRGYMRQQDYTIKTTETARERERLQQERQQFENERQQALAQGFEQLRYVPAALVAMVEQGNRMDWIKFMQDDPVEANIQKLKWDNAKAQLQHAQATIAMQQQQELAQRKKAFYDAMPEIVPEWPDEAKRKEVFSAMDKVLHESGFSEQEISGVADPRIIKALYRLVKAERQLADRKGIEEKRSNIPPRVQPPAKGNVKTPDSQRLAALKQKAASGNAAAQREYFEAVLGKD